MFGRFPLPDVDYIINRFKDGTIVDVWKFEDSFDSTFKHISDKHSIDYTDLSKRLQVIKSTDSDMLHKGEDYGKALISDIKNYISHTNKSSQECILKGISSEIISSLEELLWSDK